MLGQGVTRWGIGITAFALLVGGVVTAVERTGGGSQSRPDPTTTSTVGTTTSAPATTTTTAPFVAIDDPSPVALAWAPAGIAPDLAEAATNTSGGAMAATSTVYGDRVMIASTTDADGRLVDHAVDGLAIPIDVLSIVPADHQRFLTVESQRALHDLGSDEAILSASSAQLRGLGPGGRLVLADGTVLTIAAVVPDPDVGGAEVVVDRSTGMRIGVVTPRFVLTTHHDDLSAVQVAFRGAHPANSPIRVRDAADARFLRHGDSVLTQVEIKAIFGEFGFEPGTEGREFARADPEWVDEAIGSIEIPIIGRTECHRELLGPLRAAMAEVDELQRRLRAEYMAARPTTTTQTTTTTTQTTGTTTSTTTTAQPLEEDPDYPVLIEEDANLGCFNPRLIGAGGPAAGVSRHAWGAAIDLRPPRGAARHDPRVVEIFARRGFVNGEAWISPDAPHFEWNVPPSG